MDPTDPPLPTVPTFPLVPTVLMILSVLGLSAKGVYPALAQRGRWADHFLEIDPREEEEEEMQH